MCFADVLAGAQTVKRTSHTRTVTIDSGIIIDLSQRHTHTPTPIKKHPSHATAIANSRLMATAMLNVSNRSESPLPVRPAPVWAGRDAATARRSAAP